MRHDFATVRKRIRSRIDVNSIIAAMHTSTMTRVKELDADDASPTLLIVGVGGWVMRRNGCDCRGGSCLLLLRWFVACGGCDSLVGVHVICRSPCLTRVAGGVALLRSEVPERRVGMVDVDMVRCRCDHEGSALIAARQTGGRGGTRPVGNQRQGGLEIEGWCTMKRFSCMRSRELWTMQRGCPHR
jgi:hypothetical protein